MKRKLSWSRWVSKLGLRLRSRLRSKSKLIFELKKYKINYLFKYSKSVAESGSIVIMKLT